MVAHPTKLQLQCVLLTTLLAASMVGVWRGGVRETTEMPQRAGAGGDTAGDVAGGKGQGTDGTEYVNAGPAPCLVSLGRRSAPKTVPLRSVSW